jgi:hypothetical protein
LASQAQYDLHGIFQRNSTRNGEEFLVAFRKAICLQGISQQHDPGVKVVSIWFRFASFEVKTGDSLQFWTPKPSSSSRYLIFPISVIFGLDAAGLESNKIAFADIFKVPESLLNLHMYYKNSSCTT